MENYKNVSQDIRDQLNAKAEAIPIILTGIDNDICSTVDACPNACEMWKAIERLKQGESINVQDLETNLYWEFGKFTSWNGESLESSQQSTSETEEMQLLPLSVLLIESRTATVTEDEEMSKEKEIDKLMALISLSFKKIYKPTNNNLRTSSNTSRANQDNSPRINRGTRFGIQCYNCKEYGHVSRECQKPKRVKDAAYHKENMLLCKQEEAGVQLNAEQADWKDDTDDESEDQELEAHYMYMAQLRGYPDPVGIFSDQSFKPELVNDIYLTEHGDTNITIDSLDICYDRVQDDQDDTDDLDQERGNFSEIHKFCDATLKRTLEGLKSYYNDVKYGYVQKELTNDEVEFLKLFEEEIEVRLNYRDQMRRWEMYVNGRPLGPRRERPE
ncbi:retrovirus-related pol polyprotein from transposon TNT 1-94 [Tanacetum coccineum]